MNDEVEPDGYDLREHPDFAKWKYAHYELELQIDAMIENQPLETYYKVEVIFVSKYVPYWSEMFKDNTESELGSQYMELYISEVKT